MSKDKKGAQMAIHRFTEECAKWEARKKWNVKLKARLVEVYCVSRLVYAALFLEISEREKEGFCKSYRKAIWRSEHGIVMKEEQATNRQVDGRIGKLDLKMWLNAWVSTWIPKH